MCIGEIYQDVMKMVNKIESMKIQGVEYNTEAMTAATMGQFVNDLNSTKNTAAVCKKYGAVEVI